MRIDDEHGDELEIQFLQEESLVELSVMSGEWVDGGAELYVGGVVLSKENARKLIRRLERWLTGEPTVTGTEVLT